MRGYRQAVAGGGVHLSRLPPKRDGVASTGPGPRETKNAVSCGCFPLAEALGFILTPVNLSKWFLRTIRDREIIIIMRRHLNESVALSCWF